MWEYISKMGTEMKKYWRETAITIGLPIFTLGCAEAWQESYREMSKINDGSPPQNPSQQVIVIRDHSLSDSIHDLETVNRRLELENTLRIRRMQLELKRREAERKLQEYNR